MQRRSLSELELSALLLEGGESGFDEFVGAFRGRLFQYSYSICGRREDAEEVAQETLLRVFLRIRQLRQPERVSAWVLRIARNTCLMRHRHSIFAPANEISLDETYLPLEIPDRSQIPEHTVLNRELRRKLVEGLRRLSPTLRPVVLLRDVEGLGTEETALILDLSLDVVKKRLQRGRELLRAHLSPYCQPPSGRRCRRSV